MVLHKLQFGTFLLTIICYFLLLICYIGISISVHSPLYYLVPFVFMLVSLAFSGGIFALQAKYHKVLLLITSFFVTIAKGCIYFLWFFYVDYPETIMQSTINTSGIFIFSFAFIVLLCLLLESLTECLYFIETKKCIAIFDKLKQKKLKKKGTEI